ncbi:MAG: hypothetical protein R3D31_06900 [Hyphomicrobiaceae bacterium]
MSVTFLSSLTRISDLAERGYETAALPRSAWACGDYVVCEVVGPRSGLYRIEIANGRRPRVQPGHRIIGALGKRLALFECVGDWEAARDGDELHALTAAALIGRLQSASPTTPPFMRLAYLGHTTRHGRKVTMSDFATAPEAPPFALPVVLIIGTSMSAGKTTAGQAIVRELKAMGRKVVAAKITGGAGFRDTLSFADAGADAIFDFADAGLPSTVCPPERYRDALSLLMRKFAATGADVLVAEAGASPVDPYNVDIAIEMLAPFTRLLILSAHDIYGVVGMRQLVAARPDVVTGPVANTEGGRALLESMTGLPGLCLLDGADHTVLRRLLDTRLGTPEGGTS